MMRRAFAAVMLAVILMTGCSENYTPDETGSEAVRYDTESETVYEDIVTDEDDGMTIEVELGSYVFSYDETCWELSERQDGSKTVDLSYKLPKDQMLEVMISSDARGSLDEVAGIYEGNINMITKFDEGIHGEFGGMPAYIADGVPIGEDDKDCATKLITAQPEGTQDVLVICMRYSFPKGEKNEQALEDAQAVLDSCMPMSERIKNGKVVL